MIQNWNDVDDGDRWNIVDNILWKPSVIHQIGKCKLHQFFIVKPGLSSNRTKWKTVTSCPVIDDGLAVEIKICVEFIISPVHEGFIDELSDVLWDEELYNWSMFMALHY